MRCEPSFIVQFVHGQQFVALALALLLAQRNLLELSAAFSGTVQLAQPHLTHLAEATQEFARLLVRRGLSAVCIAHCKSDCRLLVSDRIGQPIPLHIGTSPKLLLACTPEPEREIDDAATELWGITPAELEEIERSLDEVG